VPVTSRVVPNLTSTRVSDVSVFASSKSIHTLGVSSTAVSDVSALASCVSFRKLACYNIGDVTGCRELAKILDCR
jgi:hypothetical protein